MFLMQKDGYQLLTSTGTPVKEGKTRWDPGTCQQGSDVPRIEPAPLSWILLSSLPYIFFGEVSMSALVLTSWLVQLFAKVSTVSLLHPKSLNFNDVKMNSSANVTCRAEHVKTLPEPICLADTVSNSEVRWCQWYSVFEDPDRALIGGKSPPKGTLGLTSVKQQAPCRPR